MSPRKMRYLRVRSLLFEVRNELGHRNENLVIEALEKMERDGEKPDWLYGWQKSEPYSEEDRSGKDIIFFTDIGDLFLNTKSSEFHAKRFQEKGKQKRKHIPVVVIDKTQPLEIIGKQVIEVMSQERDRILAMRNGH